MDNKVTVISREGKAEIFTGSAFHVLNDASSTQFKTNVISVFSEYLKDKKVENVFYSKFCGNLVNCTIIVSSFFICECCRKPDS